MKPLDKLRIPFESDTRFECIGTYADGKQFMAFVTGAFPGMNRFPGPDTNWQTIKSWNAVIHKFDSDGNHIETVARRGGFGSEGQVVASNRAFDHLDEMLDELGLESPKLGDIFVRPFEVEIDGVIYALEHVCETDEEDGEEYEHVMLWPNDIMFHPPWDSGEYST